MELFPAGAVVRRLSLVRLSSEIGRSVANLGRLATEGEVVRPTTTAGGRVYFTLRDRAAQVTVVCPPSRARRCRAVHGERVGVTGSLTWATDRGQLHLVAEEVVPVGEGAIAAALAEVRGRLSAAGLLSRARRPIPRLPRAVGVVCGTDAAVRADIESVVAARFPHYPMVFAEVNVSGPGASAAIVSALTALDARPDVDVVILARGGGDAASLLPFSDEELCRAIAAATTPVVSAIGHDRDRPLCDEVADLRCGTPSLAATAVVPDRALLQAELDQWLEAADRAWEVAWTGAEARLERLDRAAALRAGLAGAEARLERVSARMEGAGPERRWQEAGRALAGIEWRAPLHRRLVAATADLAGRALTVEALGPARVLARGYAVVKGADGAVLRSVDGLQPGDALDVTLARGGLRAAVISTAASS